MSFRVNELRNPAPDSDAAAAASAVLAEQARPASATHNDEFRRDAASH